MALLHLGPSRAFSLSGLPAARRPPSSLSADSGPRQGAERRERGGGSTSTRAATLHKPDAVVEALSRYSGAHMPCPASPRNGTRGARDKVAEFVNARSRNEAVFASGATEAVKPLSNSGGKPPQGGARAEADRAAADGRPEDGRGPEVSARPNGRRVRPGSVQGDDQLMINDRTRIVIVRHVSNVLGTINPVEEIIDIVHM